jgi:hypothetical protein
LILFFDPPQVCGDHLCACSILSFWRLPSPLIEFTDDHQVLATLKEVEFQLSQFPNGYNIDPIFTSLTWDIL